MTGRPRATAATSLALMLVFFCAPRPSLGPASEPPGQTDAAAVPVAQPNKSVNVARGLAFLDPRGATPLADIPAFRPRQRIAVCVGIDGYHEDSGYGPLQYAGRDAVGMAEVLLETCRFDQVLLLTDAAEDAVDALREKYPEPRLQAVRDVSRNGIRDRSEEFLSQATSPDDVLLFYFAGHGDARPNPYLIAGDYHQHDAPRNVLSLYAVFDWAISPPVRAQNRVFIFDACRSSPAGDGGRVMVPGFQAALTQPGHEMVVFSACDVNEFAYEDTALGHGRFSRTLIDALRGSAYKDGEENLLITHVFEYVVRTFKQNEAWGAGQTPRMFSSVGRPFALAHRQIRQPEEITERERERLKQLLVEARQHYRRNDLESADAIYSVCRRVLDLPNEKDETLQRLRIQVLAERACLLYRLGRLDESAELAELAAQVPPDGPELRLALREREAYFDLAEGRFDHARKTLEAVITAHNDQTAVAPFVWAQYGTSHLRLEAFKDASDSFGQAAMLYLEVGCLEDAAASLEHVAYCFEQLGDIQKAYEWIRKANELLKQIPKERTAVLQRAGFLHRMSFLASITGQSEDAESMAKQAIEWRTEVLGAQHPGLAESVCLLAEIYFQNGDYAKARPLYERALAICNASGPENRYTTGVRERLAAIHDARKNLLIPPRPKPGFSLPLEQSLATIITASRRLSLSSELDLDDGGICMTGTLLTPGETYSFTRTFQRERTYVLFAGGDEDAIDVDLTIVAENEQRIAGDTRTDRLATVVFKPPRTGSYTVRMKLHRNESSSSSFCSSIVMFQTADAPSMATTRLAEATKAFASRCEEIQQIVRHPAVNFSFPNRPYSVAVWGVVLAGDEARTVPHISFAGKRTLILAAADKQSRDLDLFMRDSSNGRLLAHDTEQDATPVLMLAPGKDRYHDITIKNAGARNPRTLALVGVFVE
jgi:tetratricopeptide (TPR) repeat protein